MPNILISNGMIIDGTGREAFKGSVYVAGDRIEAVIPSNSEQVDDIAGKETTSIIDAGGLVVAPGFIDCHSHRLFTHHVKPLLCCQNCVYAVLKIWRGHVHGLDLRIVHQLFSGVVHVLYVVFPGVILDLRFVSTHDRNEFVAVGAGDRRTHGDVRERPESDDTPSQILHVKPPPFSTGLFYTPF